MLMDSPDAELQKNMSNLAERPEFFTHNDADETDNPVP
jgi:hypothetical protein